MPINYYYVPVYIPADDKGSNLTGPEAAELIILLLIFCIWAIAVLLLFERMMFDDNKQDKKRHTIN